MKGFIRTPNWFIEAMCAWGLSLSHLRVFLYFYRESYGWLECKTKTSDADWRATLWPECRECVSCGTGLAPTTVSRVKSKLERLGYIRTRPDGRVEVCESSIRAFRPILRRCPAHTSLDRESKNSRRANPTRKRSRPGTQKCPNGHAQLPQGKATDGLPQTEIQCIDTEKDIRTSQTASGSSQLRIRAKKLYSPESLWDSWVRKFPSEISRASTGQSWAYMMLHKAEAINIDPFTLIECVPARAHDPRGYLLGFGPKYEVPEWAYQHKFYKQTRNGEYSDDSEVHTLGEILAAKVRTE